MKCPEHLQHLCTLTMLRERRLKVGPAQRPVARYWQGQGWVTLWRAEEAVPLRPRREPTAAQLEALASGRALATTRRCVVCGERVPRRQVGEQGVCGWCQQGFDDQAERERYGDALAEARALATRWWALRPCFLDVETTGLDEEAEVIEYALLDADGRVLAEGFVRPECGAIPYEASQVNGITDEMLVGAPRWSEVYPHLEQLLHGRLVIAHNAAFDRRMLMQSCMRAGLNTPAAEWGCTMESLIAVNGGRWPRLGCAAELVGARFPERGVAHRAHYDAALCRAVALAMTQMEPEPTCAT